MKAIKEKKGEASKRAKIPKRPIIFFTKNGKVIGKAVGPAKANDVRIVFGFGLLPGFGWWTLNRVPIPNAGFLVPLGTNDWHFSLTGKRGKGPLIIPPPGANDIEIIWKDDVIIEAWWTRDGERMERIPVENNKGEFNFKDGKTAKTLK